MTEYRDEVVASAFRYGVIAAASEIGLHPLDFVNSLKLLIEVSEPSALAFASAEDEVEGDGDIDLLETLRSLGIEVVRVNFGGDTAPADPHPTAVADESGWFLYDEDFVPKIGWVTLKVDGYIPVNAKWDADHNLWRDSRDELLGDPARAVSWVPTHWRPIVM